MSKPELDLQGLRKILRSHYREQDANTMYTQLCRASQEPSQTEQQFVMALMLLRQKILFTAKEENSGFTQNEDLVQQQFIRAIVTGLRNDNIKNEIKPALVKPGVPVPDEELLELLNQICSDETERQSKMKGGKKNVSQVEVTPKPKCEGCAICLSANSISQPQPAKPKTNSLLEEVQALHAKINEITSIKSEVEKLKSAMSTGGKGGNVRKKGHCDACVEKGVSHCDHCFKCGSTEHKKAGCKKEN